METDYRSIIENKSQGLTNSESDLVRLCNNTFLSFWSYPNPFKRVGQELCDVLVVYREHIFIFSDKTCEFGKLDDHKLGWSRWYRNAIFESVKQINGAERWIKRSPEKVYIDGKGKMPLPKPININEATRFHRIIVAHGAKSVCKEVIGGSGSLQIDTRIVSGEKEPSDLFKIGKFSNAAGFIHVLDDVSLSIVMENLDTVQDFAAYLSEKEDWVSSGKDIIAYGEEDVLAYYLGYTNEEGEHKISRNYKGKSIELTKNYWYIYEKSAKFDNKKKLDKPSYVWDRLIEKNIKNIKDNTNGLYEIFASLSRLDRRHLANSLFEVMYKVHSPLRTLGIPPWKPGYPYFFFLVIDYWDKGSLFDEDPILAKKELLMLYLTVQQYLHPCYHEFLGIVLSVIPFDGILDISYLDGSKWNQDDYDRAEQYMEMFKKNGMLLDNNSIIVKRLNEYAPDGNMRIKGNYRNRLCPCGSGKKYKNCCARRTKEFRAT